MGANLVFGLVAGSLSILSPCVLPLLPVLLGGALRQHRLAPVGLAAGLAASFTAVGLFLARAGFVLGIDGQTVRTGAAIVMAGFGLLMLSDRLYGRFVQLAGTATGGANGVLGRLSGDGLTEQFILGMVLGAVWSPCAGPTLGAAIGLAAQSGATAQAAAIMLAFSLGAVAPLLLLAYGSQSAMRGRRDRLALLARRAKPAMGALLVAMGILIASGLDKAVETALTTAMPDWLITLTTRF